MVSPVGHQVTQTKSRTFFPGEGRMCWGLPNTSSLPPQLRHSLDRHEWIGRAVDTMNLRCLSSLDFFVRQGGQDAAGELRSEWGTHFGPSHLGQIDDSQQSWPPKRLVIPCRLSSSGELDENPIQIAMRRRRQGTCDWRNLNAFQS